MFLRRLSKGVSSACNSFALPQLWLVSVPLCRTGRIVDRVLVLWSTEIAGALMEMGVVNESSAVHYL